MKINENTKITLTLDQLKTLVRESKNVGDVPAFRNDVVAEVKKEFWSGIYDVRCYYDGGDFICKRDFVIEGRFPSREDHHYADDKARLYAAIRRAGGIDIIGRVMTGVNAWSGRNGAFDVAFDISPKKLVEYRAKEAEYNAKKAEAKAAEMKIIEQEVASFDISKYAPDQKTLDKIRAYKDRNSKVNVKAITSCDKLLTYYYAAAILGWDELMKEIKSKFMHEPSYKYNKELGVYVCIFPELSIITKLQKRFMELDWTWGENSADGEFILKVLEKIKTAAAASPDELEVVDDEEPVTEKARKHCTRKELREMVRMGKAKDITDIDHDEGMKLHDRGYDVVATCPGVNGLSGALLKMRDTGEMLAITRNNTLLSMMV